MKPLLGEMIMIVNITRPGVDKVKPDLLLVLPALIFFTLDAGILIMVQDLV